MRLYELVAKYQWEDIADTFLLWYPEEIEKLLGYALAYSELRNTTLVQANPGIITMEYVDGKDVDEPYYDVGLRYENDTINYGLDFMAWSEVLGMTIDQYLFDTYYDKDVLSHILFELTFYGYTSKEVKIEGDKVKELVDEIEEDLIDE